MFLLYFLLPIAFAILAEIPEFCNNGIKNILRKLSFWLKLLFSVLFSEGMLMLLFMDFGAFLHFSPIKLLAVTLTSVMFSGILCGAGYLKKKKSVLFAAVFFLLIALFLEVTLFQFRFYQTFDYEEIDCSDRYQLEDGFVPTGKRENEYSLESSMSMIYLPAIEQKVHNVYFDVVARNANGNIVNAYLTIYMTDESNENYLSLPKQTIVGSVESTKYMHLLTNGQTETLAFQLTSDHAATYEIRTVTLNAAQPFSFKLVRVLILGLLAFLFWLLRPSSQIYSVVFSDSWKQRGIIVAVILLEIILLFALTAFNPAFLQNPGRHTAQYQELAESFMDGQLTLKETPPDYLAEMENPYDLSARREQALLHGEDYYWDAAYYEGNYYVYFGVLPVLLLYLPYFAITGQALPNFVAIRICLCFFVIGAFLLIAQIIKKYFRERRIPFVSYLLISLIFVNASGAVFIAKRPDFYSVPILMGLALTLFGLWFWLKSSQNGKVSAPYIAAGSLCMALVAACRPQLLLASVLIFPIFWNDVFHHRTLFSKKGLLSTVAACLPYLLVAAGVMWYNYARFGSPFDFGANYNLTTNDMTGRGFRVERLGLALFTYFFQFPNITASFPFLQASQIDTNYLGTTITEPMFGGIFVVIPLLWCLILLPSCHKRLRKKGILALTILPLLLSIVIGLFDAQGAGILQRYVSDFAFLSCLSAVFFLFFLQENTIGAEKKRVHSFLRFSFFATVAYCFLSVFAIYGVEIFYQNPTLFHQVAETVQFW